MNRLDKPGVHYWLVASLAAVIVACGSVSAAAEQDWQRAVVAADHELASAAGVEILSQGGSVVDAAVAVSFALAVVRPESCGLGGGGFLLFWDAQNGRGVALDFREVAPQAATRDMFQRPGRAPLASRAGGTAVAVPGTVAGLCHALEHFGSFSRTQVLAPALRLAREGVPVDATMRQGRAAAIKDLAALNADRPAREQFAELYRQYLDPIAADGRFPSPLVEVLEAIAEQGAAGFYEGPVADAVVTTVREHGGLMTRDDLGRIAPVVREPLRGAWDDCSVLTMPPPSSGGVALLETLGIVTAWERAHPDSTLEALGHNSPRYVHLVVEALKHAFADRARHLGDADFVDVPVDALLNPDALAAMSARINPAAAAPLEAYGRHALPDDGGTSHFAIIDAQGNAVACTQTINTAYGSLVVVPRYGIVLNNEMDDFTSAPGEPNAFGLIQGEANAIEPGKRPLSSMTPTILVRDGAAVYAAGASGGPRIISATLQVLLNMTRFGMSPQQAVSAPRFHHQWSPDELKLEPAFGEELVKELEQRGHRVQRADTLGAAQAAARGERLSGGSDPRKGGAPRGQ